MILDIGIGLLASAVVAVTVYLWTRYRRRQNLLEVLDQRSDDLLRNLDQCLQLAGGPHRDVTDRDVAHLASHIVHTQLIERIDEFIGTLSHDELDLLPREARRRWWDDTRPSLQQARRWWKVIQQLAHQGGDRPIPEYIVLLARNEIDQSRQHLERFVELAHGEKSGSEEA